MLKIGDTLVCNYLGRQRHEQITEENRVSWILGHGSFKINKKTLVSYNKQYGTQFYTQEDWDLREGKRELWRNVHNCLSVFNDKLALDQLQRILNILQEDVQCDRLLINT